MSDHLKELTDKQWHDFASINKGIIKMWWINKINKLLLKVKIFLAELIPWSNHSKIKKAAYWQIKNIDKPVNPQFQKFIEDGEIELGKWTGEEEMVWTKKTSR